MATSELKKHLKEIDREIKDIKEKLETLSAWKGIYVRYSYPKSITNVIKSTVISYLNVQEEFDIIRKIKKLHFEVKPAFLETVLDKIRSYDVQVEILTPPASLSDDIVNEFSQKIDELTKRVGELESSIAATSDNEKITQLTQKIDELGDFVHKSVENIEKEFDELTTHINVPAKQGDLSSDDKLAELTDKIKKLGSEIADLQAFKNTLEEKMGGGL